uniref:Uncharacterized protein n=1 Tax=Globisporangium ultimum (strain ATCC 200006 / CBS 805.95 / DAOM BR144) TaxID=431595 RepID=K3WFM9_GLOUD
MEQLKQETRALAQTNAKFRDFLQAQDHILRIPSDITNPLKRTTQELTRLHAHAEQMDMMQGALDEDARAFKRAKADTRATFLNLRKRFAMKMKASPALSEFATALGANGSR